MPKTKVLSRPPDDIPLWNVLVTELGDPRPYEPTIAEFADVAAIVDAAGLDDLLTDLDDEHGDALSTLDRAVEDAEVATADLVSEGHATLDHLIDEFRERHGILVPDPAPDLVLLDMMDRTVVLPVLTGERTIRYPVVDPDGE